MRSEGPRLKPQLARGQLGKLLVGRGAANAEVKGHVGLN